MFIMILLHTNSTKMPLSKLIIYRGGNANLQLVLDAIQEGYKRFLERYGEDAAITSLEIQYREVHENKYQEFYLYTNSNFKYKKYC